MPDQQGTITAGELRNRLARKRARRDDLRGERKRINERLDELGPIIKRLIRRLRRRRSSPAEDVVKWCHSKEGVTETPYGSNWGEPVATWIRYTGYSGPVPWCGCFAAYAVCHEGLAKIPTRVRLGYHGYIIADAKANRNGLRAVSVSDAKPGDIVAYDFAHIGVVVGPTVGGYVHTVEGNTSNGTSGSQNNGGGVYERKRPVSDVAVIARPDYP